MPVRSRSLGAGQWRQSGLRMSPEAREALRRDAFARGRSMEDVLQRILEEYYGLSPDPGAAPPASDGPAIDADEVLEAMMEDLRRGPRRG